MKPYLLSLTPAVKDYLWGGTRLQTEYGIGEGERTAEGWMLSCHPDGPCRIRNGEAAGQTLTEVLQHWGTEALGQSCASFDRFPMLIKLIDARDRLSVQVHPDDTYALAHENSYGKTEMWYVVDCDPGAALVYGVNRTLTREELREALASDRLPEVCRFVPVHPGDLFFIEAGTLHAIGAGILIAEVQQNSNITYRLSDYGRLGPDGKPRALHVEQGTAVTSLTPVTRPCGAVGAVRETDGARIRSLASYAYFTTELWDMTSTFHYICPESFTSFVCLRGEGTLRSGDVTLPVRKGGSFFLPAGLPAVWEGELRLLVSRIG